MTRTVSICNKIVTPVQLNILLTLLMKDKPVSLTVIHDSAEPKIAEKILSEELLILQRLKLVKRETKFFKAKFKGKRDTAMQISLWSLTAEAHAALTALTTD